MSDERIPIAEVFPLCLLVLVQVLSGGSDGIYAGLGREPPDELRALYPLAAGCATWAWFFAYTSRHRLGLILDSGWLVLGCWPFVAAYYLFKVQRRRAFLPIAAFLVLWFSSRLLSVAIRFALERG